MSEAVALTRYKLTADDFYRMAETGILHEDTRVELIEGELIEMAPIGADHEATVNGLTKALVMACGDRAIVSPQNSIRLALRSVPQPDFAVFRPRADNYRTGKRAGPADALLLIEVADSSIRYDRLVKLPLYARAGIPEIWIVDLTRRVLDAFQHPQDGGYATERPYVSGATIALSQLPGALIQVAAAFD